MDWLPPPPPPSPRPPSYGYRHWRGFYFEWWWIGAPILMLVGFSIMKKRMAERQRLQRGLGPSIGRVPGSVDRAVGIQLGAPTHYPNPVPATGVPVASAFPTATATAVGGTSQPPVVQAVAVAVPVSAAAATDAAGPVVVEAVPVNGSTVGSRV